MRLKYCCRVNPSGWFRPLRSAGSVAAHLVAGDFNSNPLAQVIGVQSENGIERPV